MYRDETFVNFETAKKFLPYNTSDKELTEQNIDNLYKYISMRPSAGMLFLYALLSVTHYPLTRIYSDFNDLKTLSLNYCGKKRAVIDDTNLFAKQTDFLGA